ncbi:MAG TPA: hypothetical protein VK008_07775 [Sphingobacteriaceae bacterium]|nr:hypothetical protein [Sphingobacteriaceae bacterium]
MRLLREPQDQARLDNIKEGLQNSGWEGPPAVVHDGYVVAGNERVAAALALGWAEDDIPAIPLEKLFAEAGLDLHGVIAEVDYPAPGEDMFIDVIKSLPRTVLAEYEFQGDWPDL